MSHFDVQKQLHFDRRHTDSQTLVTLDIFLLDTLDHQLKELQFHLQLRLTYILDLN